MVALRPRQGSMKKNKDQASSSVSETMLRPRSRGFKSRYSSTNELGLPVGCRFNPSDQVLVDYYLQSRIALGDNFRCKFVSECRDFYEKEPWEVWNKYGGGDETLYLFTKRRRLSPNSVRFDRKVTSGGTWSGLYPKDVVDDSVVIGKMREFRYKGGFDKSPNTSWLMEEYEIVGDDSDTVLCALRKKCRPAESSSLVNVKKRNKAEKVEEIYDQEEEADGTSVEGQLSMDLQGTSFDQPNMEAVVDFELDQDHPMLQQVFPHDPFLNDQDCYCPELIVEDTTDFSILEYLLAQTDPSCYDNNSFNLVSSGSVQDDDKFWDSWYALLNS